jgi:LemA protein
MIYALTKKYLFLNNNCNQVLSRRPENIMNLLSTLIILLAGSFFIWAVVAFNLLVRDKNRVLAAWSDIDVQLKRRHDLLEKLIEAVKQYQAYERAVMENVTALRTHAESTANPGEKARLETEIGKHIRRLVLVAENYPELKASDNFLNLQQNISDVESQIQFARRYYNGAVRNLNTRIDSFPDMLIARLFHFKYREYFDLDNNKND